MQAVDIQKVVVTRTEGGWTFSGDGNLAGWSVATGYLVGPPKPPALGDAPAQPGRPLDMPLASAVRTERPVARRIRRSASGLGAGGTRNTTSCVNVRDHLPLRPARAERIGAAGDRANPLAHDAPEHDHAAVRGAEMLERVHRDGPLARLSVEVPRGDSVVRRRGDRRTVRSPASPPAPARAPRPDPPAPARSSSCGCRRLARPRDDHRPASPA